MSMMEFYTSVGADENLSLQDMIEFDIKSIPNGDQWRAHTPSNEIMSSLAVLDGYSGKNDSDLNGDSWMQLSQGSTSSSGGIQENTDPNLLVNPQTGVPIGQEQPRTPVTLTLSQPVNSLRDSNSQQIVSLQTHGSRDSPQQQPQQQQQQTIRVTQPQFVNINNVMQVVTSTSQGQQVFLQGNGTTVSSMSPLRQQLQNIHHLQQQQQQQSTNVSYAATQQLLNQGLQSPQKITMKSLVDDSEKVFPKPVYSYSCLIAMSLKNSDTGCLPVSEIYNFMTENFPYFKTAPDGWKNSVRHNLSLNKCFEKIENPKSNGNTKKGCLWAMNPAKIDKMDEEISKWRKKDLLAIKRSMSKPEVLEILEKGLGKPSLRGNAQTSNPDNNNTTKVINGSSINVAPVTTALQNGHAHEVTVIKQEPEDIRQTVNVNANVNVIEIKPTATMIKLDSKMEIDIKDLNNITFNSDDLNALDNSLTLDPALNDLALQNGLFDDLGSEDLNLDALPASSSPLSFSFTGISASPITVSTAGTPIKMEGELGNPPPYMFTTANGRLPSPPPYTASGQTGSTLQIIRTVSAPT